jgi:sulfite reductase (NADPH) hemoprotein beta-component
VSLKAIGQTPGDATADQLDLVADLAERYSLDDLRVTHAQNLVLPHVKLDDLPAVHAALASAGLATANIDLASDIIACPGLDYCALANARAIPIAQDIARQVRRPRPGREGGRAEDQDQRLHQRLRPPPRGPHRHPGRR